MAMTPVQRAQAMVDFYYEAEEAVLMGRSITKEGRTLTMVDLPAIRDGRREWERRLQQLKGRGGGVYSLARFGDG
ncbi:hypothetical protein [Salinicola endophyticus]|uniref:Primosomal replication protein PriB/PriC domain protein n=1 Tax=Salinicola endophyticus TaxID=1949083 RepID=A0AB74U9K2_9GAMM